MFTSVYLQHDHFVNQIPTCDEHEADLKTASHTSSAHFSSFDNLPLSLDSLDLIIPDFRSEPTFLDRERDSLSSSFLDVNEEPNDDAGQNTVDEPRLSDRSSFAGGLTYRKMKACQVLPVLAMMAAQIFGPTRELTLLKIP